MMGSRWNPIHLFAEYIPIIFIGHNFARDPKKTHGPGRLTIQHVRTLHTWSILRGQFETECANLKASENMRLVEKDLPHRH